MISESLLEFEESLSLVSPSKQLLLDHLDLQAELNKFTDGPAVTETITEESIDAIFENHSYWLDDLTCCDVCGNALSEMNSSCCAKFIQTHRRGWGSETEKTYWLAFLSNPYKTMLLLPNYTLMVFLQKGIPFQLRPLIWQKLVTVNQENHSYIPDSSSMLYNNFQHSYNADIAKQINKDLGRTFPNIAFFERSDTIKSLQTVLNVYANYDLELGYCQGLLFLVGTLYSQLRDEELTFHTLCKVMDSEPELRQIFIASSMSSGLEKWFTEFIDILRALDEELANHLTSFCDCRVFLYQWWLSFSLIHAPDLSINNKVVDFCLIEGWKVGSFKISVGLLLKNRPILMSFDHGDEEVVYQHLLNGSKWGNVINSLPSFFGDLLLSWDHEHFSSLNKPMRSTPYSLKPKPKKTHKRNISVMEKLKSFSISTAHELTPLSASSSESVSSRSTADLSFDRSNNTTTSASSLFSGSSKGDSESVYSDFSSCSSEPNKSFSELSKGPVNGKSSGSAGKIAGDSSLDELVSENQMLKFYLKKAFEKLEDETLRNEISQAMDW
ncbi:hypothetical protein FT663_01735 [Candidozyma haemuli var. vulneris]|nr:hypothetical protein FT662_04927 [[Candida] haemuloni var. vulneris]KAF3993746.1 hypothetical protein FT663_01735 [[Candida] haemuloni var. vulneris]